jgi:phage tail sheath protein FI
MPEYLSPGVYIEELTTGPRPIEGVSTSTTAMLGATERGPEYPWLVTSWLEFQRWYGSYLPDLQSFLPYSVQGYFDNGGQRLFVGRIVPAGSIPASRNLDNGLRISAVGRGDWGNFVYVRIGPATSRTATRNQDWVRFTLLYFSARNRPPDPDNIVDPLSTAQADLTNPNRREPELIEDFDDLTHTPGASNNIEAVINAGSHLVRVWFPPGVPPAAVPVADPPAYARLEGGAGTVTAVDAPDFEGSRDEPIDASDERSRELLGRGRGLAAIAAVDEVSLLLTPDDVRRSPNDLSNVTDQVINQCEQLKERFALVSALPGETNVNGLNPPRDTSYGAFYYPWIEIYDPVSRRPIRVPPAGHVAGLIARTDIERGVHKAPANEVVRDATNLEFPITKGMQDVLNPRGVNCIRDFRSDGRGLRLWGARTMSSDPQWKYINVRRLFLFVEESIEEGSQWVVFEPNDEPLWAQVRRSITNFLVRVWKSGALMGVTQEEAFFVKCDRTTMTQDDIDNGRLVCYIGIAPVKPAEFVIFRFSQKTAEAPA